MAGSLPYGQAGGKEWPEPSQRPVPAPESINGPFHVSCSSTRQWLPTGFMDWKRQCGDEIEPGEPVRGREAETSGHKDST